MPRPLFLEAITVCVGYADFLAETAPLNAPHFDRFLVLTSPADERTRELCRKLNLECHATDEFFRGGEQFNKGRGIALGVDLLANCDWLLHLDADMVLPPRTRQVMAAAALDEESIYGCDRVLCRTFADWQRFKAAGYEQHDWNFRTNFPKGFDVGTRWTSPRHGYCPIGAFQLWHSSSSSWRGIVTKPYPDCHSTAARADIKHALHWDRSKRQILPELIAIHLESEPAAMGANWTGRTTKEFSAAGTPPRRPLARESAKTSY